MVNLTLFGYRSIINYNKHGLNAFSKGAIQFESTYNRSVKIMANLPYQTHRYLIEPVSDTRHMKTKLIRNFLNFIKSIKESSKPVLKQLYDLTKDDVRTTTGSNLRNILLLTNKLHVDELHPGIVDSIKYHQIEQKEMWRISMVTELIDLNHGDLITPEGWTAEELEMILNFVCTE